MQSFDTIAPMQDTGDVPPVSLVPQAPATTAGDEIAAYSSLMPPAADLKSLIPFSVQFDQPTFIYYRGGYMGWDSFNAIFPDSIPRLWIEGYYDWSWYATMPIDSWAQELLFVPSSQPISIYELYPGGFVLRYDLGYVQPGFYYIWYYADVPGRHTCLISVGGQFSNRVIIDVYTPWVPPVPPTPTPKQKCESNPQCNWVNGNCYCRGLLPDDPQAKCESNPLCSWVNGQCLCRGLNPVDPEEQQCEANPMCSWVNGQCLCTGLNPVDPEEQQCEANPMCSWVNGQCLCTGADIGGETGLMGLGSEGGE